MAYDARPTVAANDWTAISSGTPSGVIRIQNQGGDRVFIRATASSQKPTQQQGTGFSDVLIEGGGYARLTLADDFGGVSGAAFLWAFAPYSATVLAVSHA